MTPARVGRRMTLRLDGLRPRSPPSRTGDGAAGGKVDWDGQHCRFCRFRVLCLGTISSQIPNSSRFAPHANMTLRVMGGKSGKKRQRCGNGWQGGRQKRQCFACCRDTSRARAGTCAAERLASLPGYAVVQVPAAGCGAVSMELIYHDRGGLSR